jgi:predicted phage terminase large subunit-like protein
LMAALQYADVPGYSALLLRKTFPELALPGGLMPMSQEWLGGTDAVWNAQTHTWKFPGPGIAGSGGATLTFGYLGRDEDKYRYKSAEFQFIGFDELTAFTMEEYLYLFSRLRRTIGGQPAPDGTKLGEVPLRQRGASNPGGPGHDWVNDRFIDPDTRVAGAVYVPARIDENPHLDQARYLESLQMLTPVERMRLMRGDWEVMEEGHVFHPSGIWLADDWATPIGVVRYWDLAATEVNESNRDPDWTVGTRIEMGTDNLATVTHMVRDRVGPGEVKNLVKSWAMADGFHVKVGIEREPGASGKNLIHEYARDMPGVTVLPGLQAVRGESKKTRAVPVAAAFENQVLRLNRYMPNLREIQLELRSFPNGSHDDIVDTISGGYYLLTQGGVQSVTSVSTVANMPQSATSRGAGGQLPETVAEMMMRRAGG